MATALPYDATLTGARRTFNPIVIAPNLQPGTAALSDSDMLAQLIASLRNYYAANPESGGGPQNAGPSIMDVLNQSAANDLSQQGPGMDISAPAPGTSTISPATLSTVGGVMNAGGILTGNQTLSELGGMLGLSGTLGQQAPLDALQTLGSVGASLAGANPGVVTGANTIIDMLQDPVPPTGGDIAGKALNIAVSLSPIGPINTIMSLLTGKSLGDLVKGAMTPVENAMPNMVPGTNPSASVGLGTPATPTTPPSEAMTDLAISMIGMPAPSAPTPSSAEAPMGIPGESGFGTNNDSIAISEAIAEAMSAMAESSMNAPADGPSGDSAGVAGDVGGIGDVSEGSGGASPW